MNMELNKFKEFVKNKRVAVIGIGISNRPLIKYLLKNGAKVTAFDRQDKDAISDAYNELSALGAQFSLGEDYLENLSHDIIFKTPGMRFDEPHLEKARKNGAHITSEMEVFFDVCPAKIIAVTGSDGKTTTTTLIHKILEKAGYKTWLGGNIGNPLLSDVENINADDYVVLELSSFQLHTMKKSPHIAVITNITPNHLDMHKSYEEYIDAKKNIMLYQDEDDVLIVNKGNDITRKIGEEKKGALIDFSGCSDAIVRVEDGDIFYENEKVIATSDIKIPGAHNVENYMAAIGAVYPLVSKDDIKYVANNFGGVEHRIEFVREIDGVKFYNSSIDSSPNRTINALKVFDKKIILIAGGKDKGIGYDEIGPYIEQRVKTLILIGKTSEKIYDAVMKNAKEKNIESKVKIIFATTYPEAVKLSKAEASEGDIVMLSPASTSFDLFKNFEERGKLFKKLVMEL